MRSGEGISQREEVRGQRTLVSQPKDFLRKRKGCGNAGC
jgi:hypothetical protein